VIRAVLFDLDDTLLSNDMERFLPAYLQLVSQALAAFVPPKTLVAELMRGTSAMLANRDPARTLKQAFAEVFYPAVGVPETILAPPFEAFYRESFEQLRDLTSSIPGAPAVVTAIHSSGRLVGVATNPVMPLIAVRARLRWAGLSAASPSIGLVSSYEHFHFAKPDPAFFAEFTARLGLCPAEAAMVGNSVSDDIEPASSLGMSCYLIGQPDSTTWPAGPLDAVPEWVAALDASRPAAPIEGVALEARLRGELAAIRTVCDPLAPSDWSSGAGTDSWSAVEILCHLRDVEREINLPRLEAILRQDDPFLTATDSDRWAGMRDYRSQLGIEALREFTAARGALLARLQSLEPPDWQRSARHALLGPTRLVELMTIIAEHDILHLRQLLELPPVVNASSRPA
jgi:FMN phosphatase YigB (HAD superfamily)